MRCIEIANQEETEALGKKLASLVDPGDIICLIGDLGTGKTTFTKALALGLDVDEYVTSPTFTLIQEYEGRMPLYHFDVYRIENIIEMEDIPYDEYFYGNGVSIIEWAQLIEDILPEDYLEIEIKYTGREERQICFKATNEYYEKIIGELLDL